MSIGDGLFYWHASPGQGMQIKMNEVQQNIGEFLWKFKIEKVFSRLGKILNWRFQRCNLWPKREKRQKPLKKAKNANYKNENIQVTQK